MAGEPFDVIVSETASADLQAMRPFDQKRIVDAMELHLRREPTKISKSRIKQMKQPFWCQYRLRIGDFRVYYNVDEGSRSVDILRILDKGTDATPKGKNDETN